eukprot:TRINITY_DN3956_c0_g1_i1.p1 TRINITY_DN3956_c0_g1~~TRINITY_DN3956_c0_g1_i1.p1  ORF type:complete len:109 (+),score=10.44 TRINITY_DN3956_c0_g1_i1:86-412(+)
MALRQVMGRFGLTSLLMWALPLSVLYAFNSNVLPGLGRLSPEAHTLLSGFLAVISVNVVIGFYIYMALKDRRTTSAPQPDPGFAARASAKLGETANHGEQAQTDKKSD